MKANLLAAMCLLGAAASAPAQFQQNQYGGYPQLNPANVMPNVYNPQYQPLSPYLNMNRGGNPAVNYYYGVRPGTVGGAGSFGGAAMLAPGGMRAPFMPQLASTPDSVELPDRSEGYTVPPAGHPVVFNNTLGYYPFSGMGMMGRGRSGFGMGGQQGMQGQQGQGGRPSTGTRR
jgi:hypothetical protein